MLHLTPNAALLLFTAGLTLIAVECNRPGLVLPGSAGLLATLLAIAAFVRMPLDRFAVFEVCAAFAMMLVQFRRWSQTLAAVSTVALTVGYLTLTPALSRPIAFCCGLLTGAGIARLSGIARRARLAKGLD